MHLSWSQTPTGRQVWSVHHTDACRRSCESHIRNWGTSVPQVINNFIR
jgi:hypothetical protein